MIVNEDFADNIAKVVEKLENQLGENCVLGCSMFFLIKDPDGKHRWAVISNYEEGLTDTNMLYLHQAVARHLSMDFSGDVPGPQGGNRQ